MGTVELMQDQLLIRSNLVIYGNASSAELTERIRHEIEWMWNEPRGRVKIHGKEYTVQFRITAEHTPGLTILELISNTEPVNNYFRIEPTARENISYVDEIPGNTGYFLLENLYEGSTTAAHEYGHTLGLTHPENCDLRGKGIPGIMYPRGTLVDPAFQYDPSKPAGVKGGTMHPMHRRVNAEDIRLLHLHKLDFINGQAVLGGFSNIWHEPEFPAHH